MIVECKVCEARVDAEILQSFEYYNPEAGPPGRYSFLRCQSCQSPFLVIQEKTALGT